VLVSWWPRRAPCGSRSQSRHKPERADRAQRLTPNRKSRPSKCNADRIGTWHRVRPIGARRALDAARPAGLEDTWLAREGRVSGSVSAMSMNAQASWDWSRGSQPCEPPSPRGRRLQGKGNRLCPGAPRFHGCWVTGRAYHAGEGAKGTQNPLSARRCGRTAGRLRIDGELAGTRRTAARPDRVRLVVSCWITR